MRPRLVLEDRNDAATPSPDDQLRSWQRNDPETWVAGGEVSPEGQSVRPGPGLGANSTPTTSAVFVALAPEASGRGARTASVLDLRLASLATTPHMTGTPDS